jgi:hypothetical protein
MSSERTSTPPRRARRAGLALAGLILLALLCAAAYLYLLPALQSDDDPREAPPSPRSSFEAERMAAPEGTEEVSDDAAGGGRALRFDSDRSASIQHTTRGARSVAIRARGEQCDGAPQAIVSVDGQRVLSATVSATDWQVYSGAANIADGAHRVEVSYPNDDPSGDCDRDLYVDRVSFGATAPAAAPAPVPQGQGGQGSRADARILFRGDYESGDLAQFDLVQTVQDDRIRVVSEPVRQGRSAARFEVRAGDSIGDSAPRAELALTERREVCCRDGDERFYAWSTLFADDFPTDPNKFIDFMQFKGDGDGGGPVTFMVWGEQMQVRVNGTHWRAPLQRGRWQDFVFHAKWSPDPDVGFIELYHNGRLALPRKYMATLDRGEDGRAIEAYLKQGLYRSYDFDRTGVLYHDGLVAGTSLEAVRGR